MQSTRDHILDAIKQGDVIYGIAAGGQEKLMLVYKTTPSAIFARHVTTQTTVEFDRDGRSRRCEGGGSCTIVSAAPLPAEQYDVVLGLDRKMQEAKEPSDFRLTKSEVQLLLTKGDFFLSHPLPEGNEPS